jgi:hypothetical protein
MKLGTECRIYDVIYHRIEHFIINALRISDPITIRYMTQTRSMYFRAISLVIIMTRLPVTSRSCDSYNIFEVKNEN